MYQTLNTITQMKTDFFKKLRLMDVQLERTYG